MSHNVDIYCAIKPYEVSKNVGVIFLIVGSMRGQLVISWLQSCTLRKKLS